MKDSNDEDIQLVRVSPPSPGVGPGVRDPLRRGRCRLWRPPFGGPTGVYVCAETRISVHAT